MHHTAVQGMPPDPLRSPAVEGIPRQRMTNVRHVHADLMRPFLCRACTPPGYNRNLRPVPCTLSGCTCRRRYTAADNGIASSAYRCLHPPRSQRQGPLHDCQITFGHLPCQKRSSKSILCAQHKAAGIFIDPVDGTEHTTFSLALQIIYPAIGQSMVRIIQGGMDCQTAGLFSTAANSSSNTMDKGIGCGVTLVAGSGGKAKVIH